MNSDAWSFLEELEQTPIAEESYLWPKTPIEDFQGEIERQVGVSDLQPHNGRSRPASIVRFVRALRRSGQIPEDFLILDVCCGDAIVLLQVQREFPSAQCLGLDLLKGHIESHREVEAAGVRLFRGRIQDLFRRNAPQPFHLATMLNTYRGWTAAALDDRDHDLPVLADRWLLANARFVVVTARESQIAELRNAGRRLIRLGPGEEASTMIAISDERFPPTSCIRHLLLELEARLRVRLRWLKSALWPAPR